MCGGVIAWLVCLFFFGSIESDRLIKDFFIWVVSAPSVVTFADYIWDVIERKRNKE